LIKVFDLGEIWKERQNAPIPLAGIATKSSLDKNIQLRLSNLIKKSVEYAFSNYPTLSSFTIENAQAMEETVMRKHIELYVNNYSLELGEEGRMAINQLKKVYDQQMIEHS
jgi:1,4-dihydroxy-6-naphthoate synthase